MLRVAILSEADIDEEITRTIVESLRGEPVDHVVDIRILKRGWPAVRDQLPSFIRQLHYRTEADALAIVVDADYSVIHEPSHDPAFSFPGCRRCELTTIVRDVSSELTTVPGRGRLRFAIGAAAPAIEAWLLVGRHSLASEAAWSQARGGERFSHVKGALKRAAYGGPHVAESIRRPIAQRLIRAALGEGDLLRTYFPAGFGAFADDIHAW